VAATRKLISFSQAVERTLTGSVESGEPQAPTLEVTDPLDFLKNRVEPPVQDSRTFVFDPSIMKARYKGAQNPED
jgi:hypothetical protein